MPLLNLEICYLCPEPVPGRFGVGKRRYGMGKIKAKLAVTSECEIRITAIVMNLDKMVEDEISAIKKPIKSVGRRWRDDFFNKPYLKKPQRIMVMTLSLLIYSLIDRPPPILFEGLSRISYFPLSPRRQRHRAAFAAISLIGRYMAVP